MAPLVMAVAVPGVPFGSTSDIGGGSIVQCALQPSLGAWLPSSQASPGLIVPLPQAAGATGVQTLGVPVQVKPVSTAQAALQPSPDAWLPSSQASAVSSAPLPQSGVHTVGVP